MKTLPYILLIFFVMSCKHDTETVKSESAPFEASSANDTDSGIDVLSSETISSKKLEEYIELIKLQQEHPEFARDIALQLENFTNDSTLLSFYPKGFKISNVEQIGKSKVISDSIEKLVLSYTVTTNVMTFKDSIIAEIRNKRIVIDGKPQISKKVKFINY